MILSELIEYLEQGREIEFRLKNHTYFMSSITDIDFDALFEDESYYYIWDCIKKEDLIRGRLEEILAFKFNGTTSFQENIDEFFFEYIF